MSKSNGFLQLRRGLWEHVRDGRMTITEALAFVYICSEADTRSGIWKGCAKSLSGELGIPERTARDVLEKMEHGDYIRRFAVPGKHSCYPILVHKFLITDGEHSGEQLDALNSTDANTLRYLPAETREQSVERSVQHGVEHGAAQKRKRIEKETEKKPFCDSLPLSPLFEQFWTAFPKKVDKPAAIRAWHNVKPEDAEAILARVEINKLGEWADKEKRFIPNPATWLNGRRRTDEILPGGNNGKHSIADNLATTLSSHREFEGFN